jgi:hypothetical protein
VTGYLYGVGAGVILALSVLLWFGHRANRRLTVQNTELTQDLATTKDANAHQAETIGQLAKANAGFAAAADIQHRAYEGALADLTRANLARAATHAALRAREAAERASGGCKAVLGVDLAASCPLVAQGVKDRAK